MPVSQQSEQSQSAWVIPAVRPLDERVWQAWTAKGRAHDRRISDRLLKAMKWASIAGLFAAALWSQIAPFEVVVRFLVTTSAMVVMSQALQARYYAVAATFGALALLYNPVVPVFSFSGDWNHAVVAVSAIPFMASLAWPQRRNWRTKHND